MIQNYQNPTGGGSNNLVELDFTKKDTETGEYIATLNIGQETIQNAINGAPCKVKIPVVFENDYETNSVEIVSWLTNSGYEVEGDTYRPTIGNISQNITRGGYKDTSIEISLRDGVARFYQNLPVIINLMHTSSM